MRYQSKLLHSPLLAILGFSVSSEAAIVVPVGQTYNNPATEVLVYQNSGSALVNGILNNFGAIIGKAVINVRGGTLNNEGYADVQQLAISPNPNFGKLVNNQNGSLNIIGWVHM